MSFGKVIELFFVNGTTDSLVTAELSNWNGKAIKIPRIEVASCNRSDVSQAGVYFLFCKEDDDSDSVYIGESENIKERLMQHLRDYQSEKEKFYWNTAVIFTGRDLNKASIRYLENKFVDIAKQCKRYETLTKNTYQNTVMKESQVAIMEEFVNNVKVLISALGYKVLEPLVQPRSVSASPDEILYVTTKKANAIGRTTSEGFVVLSGAKINEEVSESSLHAGAGILKLRDKYIKEKKVIDFVTKEDLLFSSSSAAGAFITGYSVSGPQIWKSKDGRTLKQIEQAEVDK